MKMFDGFAEDSWKLKPNFTLTAGVRYDVQLTPAPGLINNNFPPDLHRVQPDHQERHRPRPASCGLQLVALCRHRGSRRLRPVLRAQPGFSTYYAMRVENGVVQVNYNYTGCESSVGSVSQARCPTVPSSANSLSIPIVPFPVTGPPLSGALYPTGGTAPAVNGPPITRSAELPWPRSQLRSASGARVEPQRRTGAAGQDVPLRSAM